MAMAREKTVQVALPVPSEELFLYSVPGRFSGGVEIGKRVFVPFGKTRKAIGYVVGFGDGKKGDFELKEIIDILDESPLFDEKRLEFFRWISDYYMASLGVVLKFAHPLGLGKTVRKTVRATPAGKAGAARADGVEKKILQALSIETEPTAEELMELVGEASLETLNALQRKGLVEFDYRVVSDEKVKYEKVYSAACSASEATEVGKTKPAKGAILEFVLRSGSASHSLMREIFGNFTAHVKWLVDNRLVSVESVEVGRDPYGGLETEEDPPRELTRDQRAALERILPFVEKGEFRPFLLHGVTGSGKTEIYIRAAGEAIRNDRQAVVLVPEISLTPLLVRRFRSRFGEAVAVVHSGLSEGERFDVWRRARRGDLGVVIGARSAVFAPLFNLGLVVVDEEHDASYKQDDPPSYNSRDAAVVLAKTHSCPVVLGSATPSLESYSNAAKSKYEYLVLPARVGRSMLPEVELVDMKNVTEKVFSPRLRDALLENFAAGRQSILFINRRGFSNFLVCEGCGELFRCPNCSVTLTFHKKDDSIKCHCCGVSQRFENRCLQCGAKYAGRGFGTQSVEREVEKLLPDARVSVMDRDYAGGKTRLLDLYSRLESGEVDVLVGTQMVAKGHDLRGVTLVGVLCSDHMLAIPDFRSGERTFQTLTQIAGRTGRGETPGRVILQTYNPAHPSVRFAVAHNASGFLEEELELRRSLVQPPFTRFISIRADGADEERTRAFAGRMKLTAERFLRKIPPGSVRVLGPSEAPLYRIKNRFRWQMVLSSENLGLLRSYASALRDSLKKRSDGVKIILDVDPYSFM